jgi:hypothetical protein
MHKSATKYNETLGKWCKNKHGASKIIDTFETYHLPLRPPPVGRLALLRRPIPGAPLPPHLQRSSASVSSYPCTAARLRIGCWSASRLRPARPPPVPCLARVAVIGRGSSSRLRPPCARPDPRMRHRSSPMHSSSDPDLVSTLKVRNFSSASTTRPSSTDPPVDDKEPEQQLTGRLPQARQGSASPDLVAGARPPPHRSPTACYRRMGVGVRKEGRGWDRG